MSFRKIRPSTRDSLASTSNPSQSTSESTGSDPRHSRGDRDGESSSNPSKRRRTPLTVTRNACSNCKKARSKCDGKKPCIRCVSRGETSECIYQIHVKHAKEELVRQIKELKEKGYLTERIFQALATDEKVPEILERLKNGETYEGIVEWLGRSPADDVDALSPRESQYSIAENSDQEMGGITSAAFQWTSVTSDPAVLDHLFQLYFAWIHPVHTLFSEGHFVQSYTQQSDSYCSSVLVNAVCTMACHLHSVADGDEIDFEQLGTEFSDAVRMNIDPDDKSITMIQAFAVMFLVDCAFGNGLRASSYLKVAVNGLSSGELMKTQGYTEVVMSTVCGVRNLSVEWAQMTFQAPISFSSEPLQDMEPKKELDDAKWYFYRCATDECPAWPSLLATTNREKSKLIEIIHDAITMMYTQHGPKVTAKQVLQQYSRYVSWREKLPTIIGNIENNNSQALPHVLSLLILYSNSVIQLLRPLLDFEGFPTPLVEEVIWHHAQQGLFLLDEHYRTQYTCRFQPVLQMFAILHLSDVIARFFPYSGDGGGKNGAQVMKFAVESLTQSHTGFPIAGALQEMLGKTANECSIPLPENLIHSKVSARRPKQAYTMDDFMDAVTRPTYVQPVDAIHMKYLSSFSTEWIAEVASSGFRNPDPIRSRLRIPTAEERGAQSLMQIRNLLNAT